MKHTTFPRALVGAVRAETPDQMFAQIQNTLSAMRGRHDDLGNQTQARIDGVEETVQNLIGTINSMEGIAGPPTRAARSFRWTPNTPACSPASCVGAMAKRRSPRCREPEARRDPSGPQRR